MQVFCNKAFATESILRPMGLCGTSTQRGISLFKRETDIFLDGINGVVSTFFGQSVVVGRWKRQLKQGDNFAEKSLQEIGIGKWRVT